MKLQDPNAAAALAHLGFKDVKDGWWNHQNMAFFCIPMGFRARVFRQGRWESCPMLVFVVLVAE